MIGSSSCLIDNKALILSISVLCKDYFSLAEINRLFIYAGADETWKADLERASGSQRMDRVNEWVVGIRKNASKESADRILANVSIMILNEYDPDTTETGILRDAIDGDAVPNIVHSSGHKIMPHGIEELLEIIIKGLSRAMYPFCNRRKGKPIVQFSDEYDIQDLFHTLLLPWVNDIRAEEHTPSFAGASARPDFELREHSIICELKYVRDRSHAKRVCDELLVDISRYGETGDWQTLYIIVYDPGKHLRNPAGLKSDLESKSEKLNVNAFIL